MKAIPQQPRPFVPYQPPKQLMDAHARAMEYQRIPGYTEQNKHLVVTCSVSSTQIYTVGK